MSAVYGGIEAGGTKFVCALGDGPDSLVAETRFETTAPDETLGRAIGFFRKQMEQHSVKAIGVASFGPLDLRPGSPTYGSITSTPKPGWQQFNIIERIQEAFRLPVGFDTDVNGAALAEGLWGAAQGLHTFVYLTIGTGIGGGAMVNGELLHGLVHAEVGHMRVPHDVQSDGYLGTCPYHRDCLEGLAAGPALEGRWGQDPQTLPDGHPAWELEAHYLALALVNIILVLSPQRIILGGGVMERRQLFPLVRGDVRELLHGYLDVPQLRDEIDGYIVPPQLGKHAGVLGAIALAHRAAG